jgi:predicted unusual protein kinase regulating ubiquinone biosynthesis (AarF/ABC1/UbiB family)
MAPELAASVVERELGAPPEVCFAEWDPLPIAAASIGQVHRAIAHDGRALAVKVQYPGVDDAVRSDLTAAAGLFLGARQLFPGVDAAGLLAELRERIAEELDYRIEAANQQRFAEAYDGHPHIHVPRVHLDLSSTRVLASDLVVGDRFEDLVGWDQAERDLAGETIFRFVFGSLYRLRSFNGDPHPGNYLFHGGGRVTFLDFGMVKGFSVARLAQITAMLRALAIDEDPVAFRAAAVDAGYLPETAPVSAQEVADYFGHFYAYFGHDGPWTMTPAYAQDCVRRYFFAGEDHRKVTAVAGVPSDLLVIQRIQLGLVAVLGDLHATADWRRISGEWWPFASGEPGGALGAADQAWRSERAERTTAADPTTGPGGS